MADEQFYKRVKGPMNNYEDWYYLCQTENGAIEVRHVWSHVSPQLQTNSGSQSYTLDDFMKSQVVHTGAQIALRERLKLA